MENHTKEEDRSFVSHSCVRTRKKGDAHLTQLHLSAPGRQPHLNHSATILQ